MQDKAIRALKIEPGAYPQAVTLQNNLRALQEAVSDGRPHSLIEFVQIEEDVSLMVNEEGKLIGLKPNRRWRGDLLVGTFYVVAEQEGELVSLSDQQIARYTDLFAVSATDITQEEVEESMRITFLSWP